MHVDEYGRYIADHTGVWTGTLANGSGAGNGNNCDAWESSEGALEGVYGRAGTAYDESWTEFLSTACSQPFRLYCFSNVVTLFWDNFELTGDTSRWSDIGP